MPAESSVDPALAVRPVLDLTIGARLAMVALGYLPALHVGVSLAAATWVGRRGGMLPGAAAGAVALYLIPPLAARMARPRAMLRDQRYLVGSPGFLRWWYASQWQVVFNRLPWLEELLRLAPGAYSLWMRLWGARIGRLVYWSPGVTVFDRSFLDVGDQAVIGAGTTLCPHFLARSATGMTELVLAPIVVGRDALVGGMSLLPAGVEVDAGEQTPGGRPLPPFVHLSQGRRVRKRRFPQPGAKTTTHEDKIHA